MSNTVKHYAPRPIVVTVSRLVGDGTRSATGRRGQLLSVLHRVRLTTGRAVRHPSPAHPAPSPHRRLVPCGPVDSANRVHSATFGSLDCRTYALALAIDTRIRHACARILARTAGRLTTPDRPPPLRKPGASRESRVLSRVAPSPARGPGMSSLHRTERDVTTLTTPPRSPPVSCSRSHRVSTVNAGL